jgi:hypothetical protein
MTGVGDVLARIVAALEVVGIPHMIAGSFASTHFGLPRSTYDIDVVIEATPAKLDAFVRSLSPDSYYVDPGAAREALRHQGQFNVIDMATGWKIDLIIRKNRPFSVEEFGRRIAADILGVPAHVATAEDTIIAKLEWARLGGGSERQLRDVQEIVDVRGAELDRPYIERWVDELGLRDEWARIRRGH